MIVSENTRKEHVYLIFTSLAHFANDGNSLLLTLLIVYYTAIPSVSIVFVGGAAIVYNVISGLLSAPVGRWADRIGRDTALISLGLILQGAAVVSFSLPFVITRFWIAEISAGAILLGFGQSFYHPLGASVLKSVYGPLRSPAYMGINGAFGSIGRAATPAIFGVLALYVSIYAAFAYLAVSIVVFSVLIYASIGSFRRKNFTQKQSAAVKTAIQPSQEDSGSGSFLFLLTASVFLRAMMISGVTLFMGEYIFIIIHSKALTSEILTLSFIPPVIGQAYFGRVTSRIGGKNTTVLTGILSIIFFAAFLLFNNIIIEVVLYSLFNLVAFTGFPVLLGFVAQQISGRRSGFANSMVWGVGNTVGGATGIGVITALVIYIPLYSAFWIMVVFGLASLPVLIFIRERKSSVA